MATKAYGVGAQQVRWGINYSGLVNGTSTSALANAASSGMGLLLGVENINIPMPAARSIAVPGDNGLKATVMLAPNTPASGNVATTIIDPLFSTAPVSLLVDTQDTLDLALMGVPCPEFKSCTLINNAPGGSATSGAVGNPGYLVEIYPNVQFYPRGNDNAQDGTTQQFMTDMQLSMADRYPWGVKPTIALNGATQFQKIAPFFSPAPMTIDTIVGDGIITTFVLNEIPYAANGTAVRVIANASGVATPLVYGAGAGKYTVVASTKTITFGTALTSGTVYTVFYQYLPLC